LKASKNIADEAKKKKVHRAFDYLEFGGLSAPLTFMLLKKAAARRQDGLKMLCRE